MGLWFCLHVVYAKEIKGKSVLLWKLKIRDFLIFKVLNFYMTIVKLPCYLFVSESEGRQKRFWVELEQGEMS